MRPRPVTAMLVLLGLAILINYVDRGNLATAATLIKAELRLNASQLGFLLSAFFITYVPMQPVVGWLVERYGASRVLLAGFLVWSFATVVTGLTAGFVALFGCRLLLGVGESVSFPATAKLLAEHVGETGRGLANGITQAGVAFGPAFGVFFGGMLTAAFGWRFFFIGFGAVSLVWAFAWLLLMRVSNRDAAAPERGELVPAALILREPSLWGASVAHFCGNFALYFNTSWIPYYLVHERHWSLPQMAMIGGVAYLASGASSILTGTIADAVIRKGAAPTVVRKSCWIIGGAGAAVCLIGVGYSGDVGSAIWLVAGGIFFGASSLNTYICAQTMGGPAATGRWVGVQNCIANVAGLIAPSLTGVLVDATGSFKLPFTIVAIVSLAGAAAWVFLTGRLAPIDWEARRRELAFTI
ncbi:MAG TPA: MFS transporter [Candidatus Binatia bacterium]|nr:MFS transporter [Candidatus Binatia bacterium]